MAKKASILLNLLNWSPKRIALVLSRFNDIDKILDSKKSDLSSLLPLEVGDIEELISLRESRIFQQELDLIKREGVNCIDCFDRTYPELLREISSPPLLLYVKGNTDVLNKFSLAIVGSRAPSQYGLSVTEKFSRHLASLGIVIISGLARGIDSIAHQYALSTGESVAVLGSGLLNIYPKENKSLAQSVSRQGALISEFPLRAKPLPYHFPRRNRIVSGLSRGVVVIEAAAKSGSLITANYATQQNRDVFAIPGNISSDLSQGTNSLIKEGAKPVTSPEEVLEEFQNFISR